jgi:hypothetical protein
MAVALKAAGAAILPYAVDIKVSRKPEKMQTKLLELSTKLSTIIIYHSENSIEFTEYISMH